MPIETFGYPDSLNAANPPTSDGLVGGDDHIRGIKSTIKSTLPGVNAAITRTIGTSFGFLAGPGTALTPSFAFASNNGLGWYDAGSNTIGQSGNLAVGGTLSAVTSVSSQQGSFSFSLSVAGNMSVNSAGMTVNVVNATTANLTNVSASNVSANVVSGNTVVGAIPAGFICDFAGVGAPAGWLACDGTALSTTTYAQLFARIGYTWGGSGGTFLLPNLISRFRRHRDNAAFAGFVGNTQGPANLAHSHTGSGNTGNESNDHTHHVSITSGTMSDHITHSHTVAAPNMWITSMTNGSGATQGSLVNTAGGVAISLTTDTVNLEHTHGVVGDTAGRSATHTHSYSFTTNTVGDVNEARPYSATVLACIKVFD